MYDYRVTALQNAVIMHRERGSYAYEVVHTAETFYTFLSAGSPPPADTPLDDDIPF